MYGVYKRSPGGAFGGYVRVFEHEIDALDWCEAQGWEWRDPETRFVWKLVCVKV